MTRRPLTLALLAGAAIIGTACGEVGLDRVDLEQVDVISGKARANAIVCATEESSSRGGPAPGDESCGSDRAFFDADQVLVAFRVPEGTSGPGSVTGVVRTDRDDGSFGRESVTFTRDASYEDELERTTAEGEENEEYGAGGTKWIGYRSEILPDDARDEVRVAPDLEVDDEDRDRFRVLTVVGGRFASSSAEDDADRASDLTGRHQRLAREHAAELRALSGQRLGIPSLPADRPVNCDESIVAEDTTICISDPDAPSEERLVLRELVVFGDEGFATPGTTATVPFRLATSGPPVEGHDITLTAATELGGATATSQWPTTDLPSGEAPRAVDVAVPADAAPGTYAVTLTASAGDESRVGRGTVVVVPATAATQQNADPAREALVMNSDGTVSFSWSCRPMCGNLTATALSMKAGIAPTANTAVSKPRLLKIGSSRFMGVAGKKVTAKIRLFPRARRAIQRGRTVKALVLVRQNGSGAPVARRITIRKP